MIAPVGLEKDRVLAGFKKFGVTDVYLIQSEPKQNSEKPLADNVRKFAQEIKEYLEKIMNFVSIKETNITDLKSCLSLLKRIVTKECENNVNKIYINISTSSKIFAIASIYIAGLYPNLIIPFYVKTTNYLIQEIIDILKDEELKKNREEFMKKLNTIKEDFEKNGWTKGDYQINLIPALPFREFTNFQRNILKVIISHGNKIKMQDLMNNLKKDQIKERSFRSKLSYALTKIIDYGVIKKSKRGKDVIFNLTEIGEIFSKFLV
ncbi:MAG: hypothetical protein JXA99_08905 [Candidatus Lokiarchaeota archaeon]|nr:hypothetical protein [Candidatus Lokiarchaeota archaeon]